MLLTYQITSALSSSFSLESVFESINPFGRQSVFRTAAILLTDQITYGLSSSFNLGELLPPSSHTVVF